MKILLVNYEFPPVGGGGATAALHLSRELVRRGHTIHVITTRYQNLPKEEVLDGVRITRIPALRRRQFYCGSLEMLSFLLSGLLRVFMRLARERYDVMWVFFGLPDGPIGVMGRFLFGTPFVLRMGGGDVPGFKPFRYRRSWRLLTPVIRRIWRSAAVCVTPSAGLAEAVTRVDFRIVPQVIPNGVDPILFSPPSPKNPHDGIIKILCVSQLIKRKGLDHLIEAFADLIRKRTMTGKRIELHLAGSGPMQEDLRRLAKEKGMNEHLRLLGHISHADLPDLYRTADLFVLPSLAEGMSNALLEALASGLPVVVTETHGVTELITNGKEGLIVAKADPIRLAEALERLVTSADLRGQMGKGARAKGLAFDWRGLAERYEELFTQVLSAASGKKP